MSEISLYLVDASPYIFRAYFALPASITAPDGRPVHAVRGFADTLLRLLQEDRPSHLAVAFDGSLTTSFRNEFYPAYKAQRELPPAELHAQLEDCRAIAEALGAACFISDRYEADDLIATLLRSHRDQADRSVVVSGDKDLAQLVDAQVQWYDLAKGRRYGPTEVRDHFGVPPHKLLSFQALRGDAVDNIPGVKGIGDKTAAALLAEFEDLDDLYTRLNTVPEMKLRGARSVARKLEEGRAMAEMSRRLARLVDDAPLHASFESLQYQGPRRELLRARCEALGFGHLLRRVEQGREGAA